MTDEKIKWRDDLLDDVERLLVSLGEIDPFSAPRSAAVSMSMQAKYALYEVRRRRTSGITDLLRGIPEQVG